VTLIHGQSNLDWLNGLTPSEVISEFLKCCGSSEWARRIEKQRPFENFEDLSSKAAAVWWSLDRDHWLEAFHSHPKIGEQKAKATISPHSQAWSGQEQAGMQSSTTRTIEELAVLNREYEEKFGFIYIVCATGKSSEELLRILRDRLANTAETELRNATAEQAQITKLRLNKLLTSWEQA